MICSYFMLKIKKAQLSFKRISTPNKLKETSFKKDNALFYKLKAFVTILILNLNTILNCTQFFTTCMSKKQKQL